MIRSTVLALVLAPALLPPLLVLPAAAQPVSDAVRMEFWCGLAFTVVVRDAPSAAPPEQQAIIDRFVTGAEQLLSRASAAYLEAGHSEESLAAYRAELEPRIVAQVVTADEPPDYSFEQCSALLGL